MVPRSFAVDSANVVIFDAADAAIAVLDLRTGRALTRFGRKGGGPGELRDVARVEFLGRRVALLDRANSRLSLFDLSGRLVGERAARVASAGASCAISQELLAVASLGPDEITFIGTQGESLGSIHRLIADTVSEPLLRMPLLAKSSRVGACIAVRPYGGQLVEFTPSTIVTRRTLYRDSRPVRVQRRENRREGGAVQVVKGSPTVEDICTGGELLLTLRSVSSTSKMLDVFQQSDWRFLGSVPIDASTIMIGCSGKYLIAKEYRDGLQSFAAYSLER
jgi:hypothetical protein